MTGPSLTSKGVPRSAIRDVGNLRFCLVGAVVTEGFVAHPLKIKTGAFPFSWLMFARFAHVPPQ